MGKGFWKIPSEGSEETSRSLLKVTQECDKFGGRIKERGLKEVARTSDGTGRAFSAHAARAFL